MYVKSFITAGSACLILAACGSGSDAPPTPPIDNPEVVEVAPPATDPNYGGITCEQFKLRMRDGVYMNTYLYKPAGATDTSKYPVVVSRSPYGRLLGDGCFKGGALAGVPFALNGYAYVFQSTRGTFESEGPQSLLKPVEGQDGYDTVEWAARQPWSTGKVGLSGSSYLAFTAWQAAKLSPPSLAALSVQVMGSDVHDNIGFTNGVQNLLQAQTFMSVFVPDQLIRTGQAAGTPQATIDQQVADFNAAYPTGVFSTWASTLPMTSLDAFRPAPEYYEWLQHPYYDDYWKQVDLEGNYQNIKVPVLIAGASYDPFSTGTTRNFDGMRTAGGTEAARTQTRLIWQAYGHSPDTQSPSFGSDEVDPAIEMRFFDHYLKGAANDYENDPLARIYVLVPPDSGTSGSGFWINTDGFPMSGTTTHRYYLASDGAANTRDGDGVLTSTPGSPSASDHFTYDPADPVPTVGGNMCCIVSNLVAGAKEQAVVESRPDVLVYTSDALQSDMPIIGMVKATIWAASSAVDTDFTVKLVDVRPDGQTNNIVDSIVRASLRNGSKTAPSPIVPGEAYQYTLDVGNVAMVLPKGHKLRIQVSSSNFPHYGRNLNTGNDYLTTSTIVKADQTILHDTEHPSFIEIPVAPITRPND